MAMISAPSIIITIDNDIDVSSFYGIGEEEESENMKLLYEYTTHISEPDFVNHETVKLIEYRCPNYPKPHLNLISPPPDILS